MNTVPESLVYRVDRRYVSATVKGDLRASAAGALARQRG